MARHGLFARADARIIAFWSLFLVFVLLTLGVVFWSPISPLYLDQYLFRLDLRDRWPGLYPWLNTYVVLGQRAPATFTALPWILWRAWRLRSRRPLVLLCLSLLLLNVSVGVVKLLIGRIGPLQTHRVHLLFAGGDIYPSGHVSNAVVLYGILAMIAVKYRRFAIYAAVFICVTVGLSTVYLDTHWFTDVAAGWVAGGLVLLGLPTLMPVTDRLVGWAWDHTLGPWFAARSLTAAPPGQAADDERSPMTIVD